MKSIETRIGLPPGIPDTSTVHKMLGLIFDEFRWFTPARYGFASLDATVPPGKTGRDELLAFYEERRVLCVAARTDRNFILLHPARVPAFPYTGSLSWTTLGSSASKPSWREAHARQVEQLMALLRSPLAVSALVEDIDKKHNRWIRRDVGSELICTVRDYSEGLEGLYWRNFFGPSFVKMFGERLGTVPASHRTQLRDGFVLLEPYALPGDAETDEGRASERRLIEQLGSECFYDHERHVMPARTPELPPSAKG